MNLIAETYVQRSTEISRRLFSFLLIITSYMAQYMGPQKDSFYTHIEQKYGEKYCQYLKHEFVGKNWNKYSSLGGGQFFLKNLTDSLKNQSFTCGEFSQGLVSMFMYADWGQNRGLGKWDLITLCAVHLLRGEISLEQMADQAFSLCHQNGTIFEKGYFYQRNTDDIYHILDVQDSGQIPQWIGQNLKSRYITDEVRHIYQIMSKYFPNEMKGRVDENLVYQAKTKREQTAIAFHAQLRTRWNNPVAVAKPAAPLHGQKMNDIIFNATKFSP